MPLPDANNYSMRIYELLKETDLENLSYAQFQGVAEKLFIEPENEDEMRRLVLVQLARMAVRGDWDGFLSGSTGTIGGSIADNQVGIGASVANTIEGSSALTFDTGTLQMSVGTDTPKINLSNNTKAVTLQVDTNQKLTVKGALNTFVLDVSSATSGLTFPDGTTQTTAATAGTNYVIDGLVSETPSTESVALLEDLTNQGGTGYGNRNITISAMTDSTGSFMYYRSFNASKTGTLSAVINQAINSTASAFIKVAFYNSDADGNPNTLIGQASIDMSSFAVSKQTTVTPESAGSMDLTKGDLYWVGIGNNGGGSGATGTGYFSYETNILGLNVQGGAVGTGTFAGYTCLVGAFTPPSTFALLSTAQRQAMALGGLYS